ncbi:MAG: hypothetical protein WCF23_23790 [Candidatus Nitrosopolaris sp.]
METTPKMQKRIMKSPDETRSFDKGMTASALCAAQQAKPFDDTSLPQQQADLSYRVQIVLPLT